MTQTDASLAPSNGSHGMRIEIEGAMGTPINPVGQLSEQDYYKEAPVIRTEHRENMITRLIEHQTAKISSNYFLLFALASMGASLVLELAGRQRESRFVGMWPAPVLL